jgi:hypothetical protein
VPTSRRASTLRDVDPSVWQLSAADPRIRPTSHRFVPGGVEEGIDKVNAHTSSQPNRADLPSQPGCHPRQGQGSSTVEHGVRHGIPAIAEMTIREIGGSAAVVAVQLGSSTPWQRLSDPTRFAVPIGSSSELVRNLDPFARGSADYSRTLTRTIRVPARVAGWGSPDSWSPVLPDRNTAHSPTNPLGCRR